MYFNWKNKLSSNFKIILLTQEPGYIKDNKLIGNRSCALIEREHKKIGNTVTQLRIKDCEINKDGKFLYKGKEFDLNGYQGVIHRTWGDPIQKNKSLNQIMPYMINEKKMYPDNSINAIKIAASKTGMQAKIEEVKVNFPLTLVLEKNKFNLEFISKFIKKLQQKFKYKLLNKKNYPAYVIKSDIGTHGNGVKMFFLGEEQKLIDFIKSIFKNDQSCILQEYIKPSFQLANQKSNEECSSHYRIVMSRQKDNSFNMIGGLLLQRTGSWVSNTHCKKGKLYKEIVKKENVPPDLLEMLAKAANNIGLNQFGADVIKDDQGKFYILELNDSMGLSGKLLEEQGVANKHAKIYTERLKLNLEKQYKKDITNNFDKLKI